MTLNFGNTLFPSRPNRPVVSYDFIDTLTGQGYIEFHLLKALDDIPNEQTIVTTTKAHTNNKITEITGFSSGAMEKKSDIDYDFEVQVGAIMKGQAFAEITTSFAVGLNGAEGYLVCKLRKWDGTTETELGEARIEKYTETTGTTRNTLLLDIVNKIRFNKGDFIRLTIEVWLKPTATITSFKYYHDPQSTTSPSQDFKTTIPFEIRI